MTTKLFCDLCGNEIEENPVTVKVTPTAKWTKTFHLHEGCFETMSLFQMDKKRREEE